MTKVQYMQELQKLFIQKAKGFRFKDGTEVVAVDPKAITLQHVRTVKGKKIPERAQKIDWSRFYGKKENVGYMNQLLNRLVRKGRDTLRTGPLPWSKQMLGAALTLQLLYTEVEGAAEFAPVFVKEAVAGFEDCAKWASHENVQATIETPSSHHGIERPERKKSSADFDARFAAHAPMTITLARKPTMMPMSRPESPLMSLNLHWAWRGTGRGGRSSSRVCSRSSSMRSSGAAVPSRRTSASTRSRACPIASSSWRTSPAALRTASTASRRRPRPFSMRTASRRRRREGTSVNDALCDTLLHLVAVDMDTNILGRHVVCTPSIGHGKK